MRVCGQAGFPSFDGNAAPSSAMEEMESKGMEYCVVFDDEGVPASLASLADVKRAGLAGAATLLDPRAALPPVILAPEPVAAANLAADPTVTLLEFGALGAVVMSGRRVKGILPASLVLEALSSGGLPGTGRVMGVTSPADFQLGGVLTTPVARLRCLQCGYLNQVDYLDPDNLPACGNPLPPIHTLKIA